MSCDILHFIKDFFHNCINYISLDKRPKFNGVENINGNIVEQRSVFDASLAAENSVTQLKSHKRFQNKEINGDGYEMEPILDKTAITHQTVKISWTLNIGWVQKNGPPVVLELEGFLSFSSRL